MAQYRPLEIRPYGGWARPNLCNIGPSKPGPIGAGPGQMESILVSQDPAPTGRAVASLRAGPGQMSEILVSQSRAPLRRGPATWRQYWSLKNGPRWCGPGQNGGDIGLSKPGHIGAGPCQAVAKLASQNPTPLGRGSVGSKQYLPLKARSYWAGGRPDGGNIGLYNGLHWHGVQPD